ncbi:hypothetical protein, partial [Azotobacter beijerinckii]|uniref:hypothetical protein n=1 Tax=Azotobacter beijerinckii TaxID=170623 RepID=UPI001C3174F5
LLEARQNCIPHRLTLPLDHRESLRKHLERAGPIGKTNQSFGSIMAIKNKQFHRRLQATAIPH